jgi:SAM-dependent methyltransferase
MQHFLNEPVLQGAEDALPFADATFSRVVVVDVHEHLEHPDTFDAEVARVLAPGGMAVVTTPNGNERLPVARLKRWVGMDPATYGHKVQGFEAKELEARMRKVGLVPEQRGAYSRFFTEFIELAINFGYVKVLGRRKGRNQPAAGEIAPRSAEQLGSVGGAFTFYRRAFPLINAVASLDALIPGSGGYAVGITARRPASTTGTGAGA